MGKCPAFQFYPGDWRRDTQVQMASMETRGVWIEMLCCMWDALERGKLTGTIDQLVRLLRCSENELVRSLKEIEALQIGDVTLCNNQVTVINRRMYRENQRLLKIREQTRKRVQKYRNAKKQMACNAKITLPSSSSISYSKNNPPISPLKKSKKPAREKGYVCAFCKSAGFDIFYKAYPRKRGKAAARKSWDKIKLTPELYIKIIDALKIQTASRDWKKDNGQFIPYPATWLNQQRWEDEVKEHYESKYVA